MIYPLHMNLKSLRLTLILISVLSFGFVGSYAVPIVCGQTDAKRIQEHISTLSFSSDYTSQEIDTVLEALDEATIDLNVFPKIRFEKTYDKRYQAVSSGSGLIWLHPDSLRKNSDELRSIIGHEMGHLFDYFCLTDEDRIRVAHARGSAIIQVQKEWFGGFDPNMGDHKSDVWTKAPVEDYAEIFAWTFFNMQNPIRTHNGTVPDQATIALLKQFYSDAAEIRKYSKSADMAPNTVRILQMLNKESGYPVYNFSLPESYGPIFLLNIDTIDGISEYVFTSISQKDRKYQISYRYSTLGYNQYETYFDKFADEIIFIEGVNYHVLYKQGVNKDFQLIYDGLQIIMSNDLTLEKYDLIGLLRQGNLPE